MACVPLGLHKGTPRLPFWWESSSLSHQRLTPRDEFWATWVMRPVLRQTQFGAGRQEAQISTLCVAVGSGRGARYVSRKRQLLALLVTWELGTVAVQATTDLRESVAQDEHWSYHKMTVPCSDPQHPGRSTRGGLHIPQGEEPSPPVPSPALGAHTREAKCRRM